MLIKKAPNFEAKIKAQSTLSPWAYAVLLSWTDKFPDPFLMTWQHLFKLHPQFAGSGIFLLPSHFSSGKNWISSCAFRIRKHKGDINLIADIIMRRHINTDFLPLPLKRQVDDP